VIVTGFWSRDCYWTKVGGVSHRFPTCQLRCGCHGNGNGGCLATAHRTFSSYGRLWAERVITFWWYLVYNSKFGTHWPNMNIWRTGLEIKPRWESLGLSPQKPKPLYSCAHSLAVMIIWQCAYTVPARHIRSGIARVRVRVRHPMADLRYADRNRAYRPLKVCQQRILHNSPGAV